MHTPRVLISDQSPDELSVALQRVPDWLISAEARTAAQIRAAADQLHPDVLLLKVAMLCPVVVQLAASLHQSHPHLKLMVIGTQPASAEVALEAYRQGVDAYLIGPPITLSQIHEAVSALSRGESILDPHLAGGLLDEMLRARGRV